MDITLSASPPLNAPLDVLAVVCHEDTLAEDPSVTAADAALERGEWRQDEMGEQRSLALLPCGGAITRDALMTEPRYMRALAMLPRDPNHLGNVALLHLMAGKVDEAAGFYGRGAEADPSHLPSWLGLTDALTALNEPRWLWSGIAEISACDGIMREKMPTNISTLTMIAVTSETWPRWV